MKLNQKGFTIIELLATIVIISIVLVPLLFSFTNSIQINRQSLSQRIAASVAEGMQYSVEKIDFADYRTILDNAVNPSQYFAVIDASQCDSLFVSSIDQTICTAIFTSQSANFTCDSTMCKMYLFNYDIDGQYNTLINDTNLPQSVRNILSTNAEIIKAKDNPIDTQNLIWMILWIDYYDNPDLSLSVVGIIANDDPN